MSDMLCFTGCYLVKHVTKILDIEVTRLKFENKGVK